MADYDLGSVGYGVEIRGADKAISDLKTIDSNFKTLTKDANTFKQTTVMDSVVSKLDKVEQGTNRWINLETKRQSLAVSGARYEMNNTNNQLRLLGQKIALMNRVAAVEAQAAAQAKRDEEDQINLIGKRIAMMKRSGGFGSYTVGDLLPGLEQTTTKMSRFSLVTQQAGYQFGDFIVQVQSGTNKFVAAGQQLTQLVGLVSLFSAEIKYAMPIMLGLSIVVPLITAIGAAWDRTHKEVDIYTDAVKRATDEQKKLNDETNKLRFPDVTEQLKPQIAQAQADLKKLQDTFNALGSSGMPGAGQAAGGMAIAEAAKSAFGWDDQSLFDAAKKRLDDLLVALRNYESASAVRDATQLQNLTKLQAIDEKRKAYLEDQAHTQAVISNEAATQVLSYLKAIDDVIALSAAEVSRKENARYMSLAITSAKDSASALLTAANNMTGPFASIAAFAANIASSMWDAAGVKMNLTADTSSQTGAITSGLVTQAIIERRNMGLKPPAQFTHTTTAGSGSATNDPIADLQAQINLANSLVRATEDQKQLIQGLGLDWSKYSPDVIEGLRIQLQAQIDLNERIKEQQVLWDGVSSSVEDGFMNIIEGTMTVTDAFRKMAYDIIEELYRVLVVQQMVGSFDVASGTGSGMAGMLGSAISGISFRASGGSVMAGEPYMVGEQGPELLIPSNSGKVLTASQTSSALSSSDASVTVQNNITVTGSDATMVRQTVVQMLPQITQASMNGIMDAKRRGGKMGQVFR